MDTVGPVELLIMVLAVGLLLGANRLPQMAPSLGEGIWVVGCALRARVQPCCDPGTRGRHPA